MSDHTPTAISHPALRDALEEAADSLRESVGNLSSANRAVALALLPMAGAIGEAQSRGCDDWWARVSLALPKNPDILPYSMREKVERLLCAIVYEVEEGSVVRVSLRDDRHREVASCSFEDLNHNLQMAYSMPTDRRNRQRSLTAEIEASISGGRK